MKIAYIDHSYHRHTRSTDFVPEILRKADDVAVFWDTSWETGAISGSLIRDLSDFEPDIVVFFQVLWPRKVLDRLGIKRSVMIPMYDGEYYRSANGWREYLGHQFISFSRAISESLRQAGMDAPYFQYFPEVPSIGEDETSIGGEETGANEFSGFYWHRRDNLGWGKVSRLCQNYTWKSFYIHNTPDPESHPVPADAQLSGCSDFSIGEWFEKREELFLKIAHADAYFAPRLREGIGMSFLEAMALGCCVIAPDYPTHNEYLDHGETGILYDPNRPELTESFDLKAIGERGAQYAKEGRVQWENMEGEFRKVVLDSAGGVDFEKLKAAAETLGGSGRGIRVKAPVAKRIVRKIVPVAKRIVRKILTPTWFMVQRKD